MNNLAPQLLQTILPQSVQNLLSWARNCQNRSTDKLMHQIERILVYVRSQGTWQCRFTNVPSKKNSKTFTITRYLLQCMFNSDSNDNQLEKFGGPDLKVIENINSNKNEPFDKFSVMSNRETTSRIQLNFITAYIGVIS